MLLCLLHAVPWCDLACSKHGGVLLCTLRLQDSDDEYHPWQDRTQRSSGHTGGTAKQRQAGRSSSTAAATATAAAAAAPAAEPFNNSRSDGNGSDKKNAGRTVNVPFGNRYITYTAPRGQPINIDPPHMAGAAAEAASGPMPAAVTAAGGGIPGFPASALGTASAGLAAGDLLRQALFSAPGALQNPAVAGLAGLGQLFGGNAAAAGCGELQTTPTAAAAGGPAGADGLYSQLGPLAAMAAAMGVGGFGGAAVPGQQLAAALQGSTVMPGQHLPAALQGSTGWSAGSALSQMLASFGAGVPASVSGGLPAIPALTGIDGIASSLPASSATATAVSGPLETVASSAAPPNHSAAAGGMGGLGVQDLLLFGAAAPSLPQLVGPFAPGPAAAGPADFLKLLQQQLAAGAQQH